MKTLFIYLFLLFVFFCPQLHGQKIEWSKTVNEDLSFDYVKVIGADENGYYVLKSNLPFDFKDDNFGLRKKKFSITYFDNNMVLKMQKNLLPPKNGRIHKVLFANEKVLLITTIVNKAAKQHDLYAQWINNKGMSIRSPVKIETVSYESKSDITDVSIIVSKDQNVFCVVNPVDIEKPDKQIVTATSVDTSFNVIWKKPIEIPYGHKQFERREAVLSNAGDLYLLGEKFASRRQRTVGDSYIVYSYINRKGTQAEIPVNIENNPLSDVTITFDHRNNRLMMAGFFFDKNAFSLIGTFYGAIDIEKSAITYSKIQAFDSNFIDSFTRPKQYSGNSSHVNFSINRLVLRNNGGVVILAEANYITQTSYYDYFTRTFINRSYYHYDNILTVSINPDGTIDWQQTIQKNQESQEDGGYYSSYCSLIYGSNLNIIYNSSIDRSNTILDHTISNKGSIDQNILISETEHVMLVPKGALQIDENVLIVPAYRDRNFSYAKITF